MALRFEQAHDCIEHYSMKISDSSNKPMLTVVSHGTSHIPPGPPLVSNFAGNARQYPASTVWESTGPDRDEENDHDRNFHRVEKKRRLTNEQVQSLEVSYEVQSKLEPERKNQLAKELGLQPRQVAVWFQNRRARSKARQLERDYDILKMEYDAVVLEKDMLVAEVARLRHLLDPTNVEGASSSDRPSVMEHMQVSYAKVPNLLKQEDEIQEDQFGNLTAACHWQQSPSLQSEEAKFKQEITTRHRGSDVSSDSDQGDGRSCRSTPTLVENYIPEQFYQQAAAAKLSMAEMLYNDPHQLLHHFAMKMEEGCFLQSQL